MKRYIYGFDAKNPAECARAFRRHGIDAVVGGRFDEAAADAFAAEGIDLYLCYGAHSLPKESDPAMLAQDPKGEGKKWFSSACPNEASIAQERLNSALDRAAGIRGLKGIFVDGARFASFASAEGTDAFFTCFCPRCMEKMHGMGMEAEKIRDAVGRLQAAEEILPDGKILLAQWFAFREACVREYMDCFARAVRAKNPAWQTGAFVFAPSLGYFVGQTMAACASLDIVSPMLYRAYPHEHGPACMNHEWAAFCALPEQTAAALRSLTPAELHRERLTEEPVSLLKEGFSPEEVGAEAAEAVRTVRAGQRIAPIIQIEDMQLQKTARCVLAAGADGVGYFSYAQAELPDDMQL